MRVKRLEIENILSIEHAVVEFFDSGLMLIDGWNHDDECANGAGKSSIFTALAWGLFGDFPRRISASEVIRNGAKKASCTVELTTVDSALKVIRKRPGSAEFYADGRPIGSEEFARLIGINYDQFMLVQYFAQGLSSRFLELNDTGRKDFLLTLMKADGFADAKSIVDKKSKAISLQIQKVQQDIDSNISKVAAFTSMLEDSSALLDTINSSKLNLEDNKAKIAELKSIPQPDVSKFQDLELKLRTDLERVSTAKGSLSLLRRQLVKLEEEQPPAYGADGECPACSVSIDIVNNKLITHDHTSAAAKIQHWNEAYQKRRMSLVDEIATLEQKVNKESALRSTLNKCLTKISDTNAEYQKAQNRIKELQSFCSQEQIRLNNSIKTLESQKAIALKIEEANNNILTHRSELDKLNSELLIQDTAASILAPTGAPAYVMDGIIQVFNDKVADLIQSVWPMATYALQSFRENKTGDTVAKFSDALTIGGVSRSIGALSGGERRCLALVIDMAMLETVAQYTGAQLSPVILDEPFDHLDASNRERVTELLREVSKNRQIVVVDHANEVKSLFDKSLQIVKKNGVSSVSLVE